MKWEESLQPCEKKNGEVKGALLRNYSRDSFFDFINKEPSLLIYPTIVDLIIQKKYSPENVTRDLYDYAIALTHKIKSKKLKQEEILQAKKLKNISDEQFLKLSTLGNCILTLLRSALTHRTHRRYDSYWSDIQYFIDKSSAKGSREEQVFRRAIRWFVFNTTKKHPILIPDEMFFFKNHPFMSKFDTPHGIDMERLFEHIFFENSSAHIGIKIADIIANSLYRVLNDLDNKKGMLKYYKKVMIHSHLEPNSNLGFIIFKSKKDDVLDTRLNKYSILQKIIYNMNHQ